MSTKRFIELDGTERAAPTILPPTGHRHFYPKTDGFYEMDDAGVETKVSNPIAGTDAPTVYRATLLGANGVLTSTTVSKTDFSMALTGAYSSEGVYTLTAASGTPFTANKTIPIVSVGTATGGIIAHAEVTSTSVITIRTFNDAGAASDAIGTVFVQITVDV